MVKHAGDHVAVAGRGIILWVSQRAIYWPGREGIIRGSGGKGESETQDRCVGSKGDRIT
jgi:hypothetical protein